MVSLLAAFLLASPAFADDVVLTTGEVLHGTVVERSAEHVVLEHTILGRLVIPAGSVVTRAAAPVAPAPPPPPPAPEPAGPWAWKAELGASGASGNTDTSDLHAAIRGVLDDDTRTLDVAAGTSRAETDGDTTKNQSYVEVKHDWKLRDSPWFPFAKVRMEWDDFQDYDRRLSVGAGMGYQAVKTATTNLKLRAGLVGTREWGSDDTGWRPEGMLGADLVWKVSDGQEIEAATTAYPDLETSGEYRVVSAVSWSVRLDNAENLHLKLGLEHEVDSHRESPFDKVDVRYFAAILYEF